MAISPAYLDLTDSAIKILNLFLLKKPMIEEKKKWKEVPQGQMTLSYKEIKNLLGFTGPRITRGLDKLIGNGFINLFEQGGGNVGTLSIYTISERWEFFDTVQFHSQKRPKLGLRNKGQFKPKLKVLKKKDRRKDY